MEKQVFFSSSYTRFAKTNNSIIGHIGQANLSSAIDLLLISNMA